MLNYETLNLIDTLIAIKKIKDHFEQRLSKILKLIRVSAPLFVESNKGINDNLNGVEQPVSFKVGNNDIEMLQDLIIAATNEALRKAEEASSELMGKMTGGLGGGFPF